jgi:hypothetical protein
MLLANKMGEVPMDADYEDRKPAGEDDMVRGLAINRRGRLVRASRCRSSQNGRHRLLQLLLCSLLLSSATTAGELTAADADQLKAIRDLTERWRAMRSEIVTADIHYVGGSTGSNFRPVSPEEFEELFLTVDFGDDPQRVFREQVAPRLFVDQHGPDHIWLKEGRFVLDGEQTRHEDGLGHVHLVTSDAEVWLRHHVAHRQIDIWSPGGSSWRQTRLEDFRLLPEVEHVSDGRLYVVKYDVAKIEGTHLFVPYRTATQEGGAGRPARFVIDLESGLPQRAYTRWADGTVISLTIQREPMDAGFGIAIPRLVAAGEFDRATGVLRWYRFHWVKEARLNVEIPSTTFEIAALPTDTVVDYRNRPHDPVVHKAETAASNVVEMEKPAYLAPLLEDKLPPSRNSNRTIPALLAIALLGVASAIWLAVARRAKRVSR